jgi:hypothetical protein
MSETTSSGSLLTRDEVDAALAALQRDEDAISASLLELEDHPGHLLLKGAELTGVTATKWADAERVLVALWEQFAAYRNVLDAARELRARKSRPDEALLAELSRLLTGRSVELVGEPIPLDQRGLLGPERQTERLTLAAVTARMKDAYEAVADVVTAADDAWSAQVVRLTAAEETFRAAREAAAVLGQTTTIDGLERRVERLRREVAADPLGDGHRAESDRLDAELSALRDRLRRGVALRDNFADRVKGLGDLVAQVEHAEAEIRAVRANVLPRIAGVVPEPPERSADLRVRLDGLSSADGVPWADLADQADRLEADLVGARDAARTAFADVTGLLARRDELRGRLQAYRAKAARLGGSEDAALAALHRAAHDLLWRAPCDLSAATRAVARYQRAVADLGGHPGEASKAR